MTLILRLPDGRTATSENRTWKSTDPRLATYCTVATAGEAANYLPHPFLEAAQRLAVALGAELEIVGKAENSPLGMIR